MPDSKILVINSEADLFEALTKYGVKLNFPISLKYCLDYTRLTKDFDGIYLTYRGNCECHICRNLPCAYTDLNTWDVESIVIFREENLRITEIRGL